MFTYNQQVPATFTWLQFHNKYTSHQSITLVWKYFLQIPQGVMRKRWHLDSVQYLRKESNRNTSCVGPAKSEAGSVWCLMMSWWCKEPGHEQAWFWPILLHKFSLSCHCWGWIVTHFLCQCQRMIEKNIHCLETKNKQLRSETIYILPADKFVWFDKCPKSTVQRFVRFVYQDLCYRQKRFSKISVTFAFRTDYVLSKLLGTFQHWIICCP